MARKFFVNNKIEGNIVELYDDEFNHIINVSRKNIGDEIILIDGTGNDYYSKIEKINKKSVVLNVLSSKLGENETASNVTVFQALCKNDKLELIIQKLTELGIKNFVPFTSEFCQVKQNTTRLDRLEKISIEALKQCDRSKKVNIEKVISFNEMINKLQNFDKVIFAYEKSKKSLIKEDIKNCSNVAIIVGSEGGFSEKENEILSFQKNVVNVSLGKRILRAETASICLTSVVMFLLNEWENL